MSTEFRNLLSLIDHVELRFPHSWDGSKELNISINSKRYFHNYYRFCEFLNHNLVLLPNGDVTPCCNDLNSRGIIGNLYQNDLFTIFESKKRRDMIKNYKKGKKDEIVLCKNCTGYCFPIFYKWTLNLYGIYLLLTI